MNRSSKFGVPPFPLQSVQPTGIVESEPSHNAITPFGVEAAPVFFAARNV
jgi:hypothetical protein